MKKALLVMDMQEVTVGENHAGLFRYPADLISKVNAVIQENTDATVVYIRNLMKNNLLNKLAPVKCFDKTPEAELVKGLNVCSPHCFSKYKGDAFSNAELTSFLKAQQIDTIELVGVDGGGCVSLTAFGALKAGYQVLLNTDAVGTTFIKKRDQYYQKLRAMGVAFCGAHSETGGER